MSRRTIQALSDDDLLLILHLAGNCQWQSRPVNRFPVNILSLSPMNFSLVCRSWHALVAIQPLLWSRLELNINAYKPFDRNLLHIVQTWVRKSWPAPLNFRYSVFVGHTKRDDVLENMTSLILSQAHRWKNMEFNVRYPFLESFLKEITLPPTSYLTSLCIGCGVGHFKSQREKVPVSHDLSHCPQIQTLTLLFGVRLRIFGQQPHRLEFLTRLSLCVDASAFGDLQKILLVSINLTKLDISTFGPSDDSDSSHSSLPEDLILLPNLIHISIVDGSRTLLIRLLDKLICPNLLKFAAQNTYSSSAPEEPDMVYAITPKLLLSLDNFFHRSRPPLSSFELRFETRKGSTPHALHNEYSHILRHVLRQLNDLERLYLEGLVIDDQLRVIQVMTHKEGKPGLCPGLGQIRITGEGNNVRSQSVADMVVSRWRLGKVLKYMEHGISGVGEIAKIHAEVKKCIKEGLFCYYLN